MAQASTAVTRGRSPVRRMLLGGGVAGLSVTTAAAAVMTGLRGVPAGLSTLGAGSAVLLAFAIGIGALTFVVAGPGAVASMSIMSAFVVYLGQLIALAALALVFRNAAYVDNIGVMVGGFAAVLAWQVGQVHGFATARSFVFSEAVR